MHPRTLLVSTLPLCALASAAAVGPRAAVAADVAVAPFTIEGDASGPLRALADSCLERLVRGLTAKGVGVARHDRLTGETLELARPAPLAVVGRVSKEGKTFEAELQLLEVESGDELRTYFGSDEEPGRVADLGTAAAERIAAIVKERKGAS